MTTVACSRLAVTGNPSALCPVSFIVICNCPVQEGALDCHDTAHNMKDKLTSSANKTLCSPAK